MGLDPDVEGLRLALDWDGPSVGALGETELLSLAQAWELWAREALTDAYGPPELLATQWSSGARGWRPTGGRAGLFFPLVGEAFCDEEEAAAWTELVARTRSEAERAQIEPWAGAGGARPAARI